MSSPWLAFSLASILLMPLQAHAQGNLTHFRDKNRLLLVFAPSALDPRLQRQNQLLAANRAAFHERDLLRFDIGERGSLAERLRTRYKISLRSFEVLLIGKDGHVAFRASWPITLRELTGLIDRMPMRREEIRRQEQKRQKENP